jgi:hypothetical protein
MSSKIAITHATFRFFPVYQNFKMVYWWTALLMLVSSRPELVMTAAQQVDIIDYRPLLIDDIFNGSYIASGRRG